MRVFATFDPDKPHPLTRLWIRSWRANGWRPKIIIAPDKPSRHKGRDKFIVSQLGEINVSLRPGDRRTSLNRRIYPPGSTEDTVFKQENPLTADN